MFTSRIIYVPEFKLILITIPDTTTVLGLLEQ